MADKKDQRELSSKKLQHQESDKPSNDNIDDATSEGSSSSTVLAFDPGSLIASFFLSYRSSVNWNNRGERKTGKLMNSVEIRTTRNCWSLYQQ